MTVFTIMVTAALQQPAVYGRVTSSTPAVETEIPACEMMVPCIVPPPRIPLIVAAVPTSEDVLSLCAVDQEHVLILGRSAYRKCGCHLEHPEGIRISAH